MAMSMRMTLGRSWEVGDHALLATGNHALPTSMATRRSTASTWSCCCPTGVLDRLGRGDESGEEMETYMRCENEQPAIDGRGRSARMPVGIELDAETNSAA